MLLPLVADLLPAGTYTQLERGGRRTAPCSGRRVHAVVDGASLASSLGTKCRAESFAVPSCGRSSLTGAPAGSTGACCSPVLLCRHRRRRRRGSRREPGRGREQTRRGESESTSLARPVREGGVRLPVARQRDRAVQARGGKGKIGAAEVPASSADDGRGPALVGDHAGDAGLPVVLPLSRPAG